MMISRSAIAHKLRTLRPGIWLLPVLTLLSLYLYRPFVLGFYSDDWVLIVEATHHGGPFSLERLDYAWQTFARPLMNVEVWLASSVFGRSTIAWHLFLVALAAIGFIMLRRLLLNLHVRPTTATVASTLWLLFPWSLGYRLWPTSSAILLSAIFFLAGSTALLRQRLWTAIAWYAASMLMYEAFYLGFLPILFVLAMSPKTRRWALLRATPLLLLLQIGLVGLNRLASHYAPHLSKSFDPNWYHHLTSMITRLPLTLADAIVGARLFGIIFIGVLLAAGVFAAVMAKDRVRRVGMLAALLGFLIACCVLAIASYKLKALNTPSRTFVGVDIWLTVFFALAWDMSVRARWAKWAVRASVVAVLAVLAVSTVIRTDLWQRLWTAETAVLESAPVEQLEATGPEATIVLRDFPTADGYPPFPTDYALSAAVASWIPGSRIERYFYPAGWGAAVSWDGEWIVRAGLRIFEADEVWLWRWPGGLEPITTPRQLIDDRGN